jgi:hypothetical protein
MAELKENIRGLLKKYHFGKKKALTIRDLAIELLPIRTNDREIRQAIRDLNMEEVPIFTSVHPPYGVYYGASEEERDEYVANLGARATSMLDRMRSVDKIKTMEFLKGQMELFR